MPIAVASVTSMAAAQFPLRRLFAQPVFRRWAIANLMARLPLTMNLLVLVLAGEEVTGSVSTGALLAGAATFSAGAFARWRGRRLDRVELNRGMRSGIGLAAVLVALLGVAVLLEAPVWLLLALSVTMGWSYAAVLGGFRALLVEAVTEEDLEAANALDSVFVEVAFVTGPALAALLSMVLSPGLILLLMGATFLAAIALTATLPTRLPRPGRDPAGPAPFLTRGATPIYLIAVVIGVTVGSLEALTPAKTERLGLDANDAGQFLALLAAGSAIAGVVAASHSNQLRRGRVYGAVLLAVLAIMLVPASATDSVVWFAVLWFIAGFPLAPLSALGSYSLHRIIAAERRAEGFSTLSAMILAGAGSGQLLVGLLLERLDADRLLALTALLPGTLAILLMSSAARRRVLGMPTGLGTDHDPTIPHPTSYGESELVGDPNR